MSDYIHDPAMQVVADFFTWIMPKVWFFVAIIFCLEKL